MLNYTNSLVSHQSRSGGFTLIELMIVVAIMVIIVAFAAPAYQNYTVRMKVSECILDAAPAKLSISEYRAVIKRWPPDAEMASLISNGVSEFCNGFVAYDPARGSFQININEVAVGGSGGLGQLQPQLTPQLTSVHKVSWQCSRGATPASLSKYLPSSCRDI
jgi:type IV pilus assembly protein PilA